MEMMLGTKRFSEYFLAGGEKSYPTVMSVCESHHTHVKNKVGIGVT